MTEESKLLAEIRVALAREPDMVLWRLSAGLSFGLDGTQYRAGMVPGASDLIGVGPGGRFIALEVKTTTGRVSDEQKMFMELVRKKGGFAAVVRSVDEALAAVRRMRCGGCGGCS